MPTVAPPGFELLDEVGRGGMGVVYRARDLSLDREVAVKLLLDRYAAGSGPAGRFLSEARITGQLQHPGIPAVYQAGTLADGRPFLAMKLIKGDTLDALLKAGVPVDVPAVFEGVCQAVGFAHARRVIHRDLKPQNVMVGSFGEVQVMDWGLAKVLPVSREAEPSAADPEATLDLTTAIRPPSDPDTPFTQSGSVLGTPAFMAPEQAAGDTDAVDERSDVFGLGAVLCVLLTGRPPFTGGDAASVRRNAMRGKLDDALTRLAGCDAEPELVALCRRCLSVEPADRPATAAAVASEVAALRRAAAERARAAELAAARAAVQAAEQRKRRRQAVIGGGLLAAVLLAGIGGTGIGLVRAERERNEAVAAREGERIKTEEAESILFLTCVWGLGKPELLKDFDSRPDHYLRIWDRFLELLHADSTVVASLP